MGPEPKMAIQRGILGQRFPIFSPSHISLLLWASSRNELSLTKVNRSNWHAHKESTDLPFGENTFPVGLFIFPLILVFLVRLIQTKY